MPVVLGVDSSTQSCKVVAVDADTGAVLAEGRAPHPPTTPPRSEQRPADWWTAFVDAYDRAGRPKVDAVSVAGQQHGLVVLDGRGDVIRPAKLWNDTESAPQASALVEALGGPAAWAEAIGTVPVAAITITKLAWLREHEPESFERIAALLLPHDWLTWALTGEVVTDRGDASGTGYWSPLEERWRADLLRLVDDGRDWDECLPHVLGPLEAAGEWGGAVVAAGTGDNMAAALGAGLGPGDVAISFGTSGTAYAVAEEPTSDPSGAVAGFADATGNFLPLVCTLNATKVTDAFARLLGVDHAAFDALALQADAGAGGVVVLPYLDGERTPNRPGATGAVSGLRSDVDRAQLARAAVEGVVCGLLDGVDALGAAGVDVTGGRLVLVGGGARSAAYRQVTADLTGRPVVVPTGDEHVAMGAAVQAAATLAGAPHADVVAAWGLGGGTVVEPSAPAGTGATVRAAYVEVRDR